MNEMQFIKDDKGRIITVVRGDKCARITWAKDDLDIEFCNFVITIACTGRGVGGEYSG